MVVVDGMRKLCHAEGCEGFGNLRSMQPDWAIARLYPKEEQYIFRADVKNSLSLCDDMECNDFSPPPHHPRLFCCKQFQGPRQRRNKAKMLALDVTQTISLTLKNDP